MRAAEQRLDFFLTGSRKNRYHPITWIIDRQYETSQ